MSHKRCCVLLAGRSRFHQLTLAGDDAHRQHVVGGGTALAAAPKNAVLRQTATDRGKSTRKGPPIRCSHAQRRQMLIQFLPATSGLYCDVPVFEVDLDNGIHAGHVDQDAVGCCGEIATGVAHTPAAGHDRRAAFQAGAHQRLHLVDRARSNDCTDGWPNAEDILRIEGDLLSVGIDDLRREQLTDGRYHCVHSAPPDQYQENTMDCKG